MNKAQLNLQRMTRQEINAVRALARAVWQTTYPALIPQAQIDTMLADRYAAAQIELQCPDPAHGWWVAYADDTLVGFGHATLQGTDCKLDKLYVHPAWQRQGIGTALLRAIQQWGRQQHARRLWLQVNRGNTQAIAAYQKYGFHIVESRVFDIGHGFVMDDHIMEQAL